MLVSPSECCAGMLRPSLGGTSRGVMPDEQSSPVSLMEMLLMKTFCLHQNTLFGR
jgi:hypothetical protein